MACKRICLSKENMEEAFLKYLEELFSLPEIVNAKVRDIVIHRDTMKDDARRAFEAGYHDCYSDIDLSVKACLPKNGHGRGLHEARRTFWRNGKYCAWMVLYSGKQNVSHDF